MTILPLDAQKLVNNALLFFPDGTLTYNPRISIIGEHIDAMYEEDSYFKLGDGRRIQLGDVRFYQDIAGTFYGLTKDKGRHLVLERVVDGRLSLFEFNYVYTVIKSKFQDTVQVVEGSDPTTTEVKTYAKAQKRNEQYYFLSKNGGPLRRVEGKVLTNAISDSPEAIKRQKRTKLYRIAEWTSVGIGVGLWAYWLSINPQTQKGLSTAMLIGGGLFTVGGKVYFGMKRRKAVKEVIAVYNESEVEPQEFDLDAFD